MKRSLSLRAAMVASVLAALLVSHAGPPWIAARKRSCEKTAVRVLERIGEAQVSFRTKHERFATLEELSAEGLDVASDGYRLEARPGTERPDGAWWATACPEAPWEGDRSYSVSGASGLVFETTCEPAIDRLIGEPLDRSRSVAKVALWPPRSGYVFWCSNASTTSEFLWFANVSPTVPSTVGDHYFVTDHAAVIFYTTAALFELNSTGCTVAGDSMPVGK
jgi:hypothetical protein